MGRSFRERPKKLGRKLKRIRLNLGLTQDAMIETLAVKGEPLYPASISQYETGKREPPLLVLLRYAKLAGISTDVLIDDRLDLPRQ
jgi:transcriptional regulator with XRE-family HTH domain